MWVVIGVVGIFGEVVVFDYFEFGMCFELVDQFYWYWCCVVQGEMQVGQVVVIVGDLQ